MNDRYPALGFDPAPGTVGTVTALAENLGTVAKELSEAHHELSTIGRSDGFWRGAAAEAFQDKVGPLPDYLDKANRSLGDAAKVLHGWSSDLTSLQHKAADFEAQATKAIGAVDRANANPDLSLAGRQFPDADSLRVAQSRLDAAQSQVSKANDELAAIREQARRLLAQHHDLAEQVAAALRRAKEEAPEEPGFFDRIGAALGKVLQGIKDLAARTWQFIKDHANVIKMIGDVLSTISNVLGVIAMITAPFEPIGAIFGAAAGVTSLAAAGTHLLAKAAGADVSWSSIGGDALGALPFVGGFAKGAKVATVAAKAGQVERGLAAAKAGATAAKLEGLTGKAMEVGVSKGLLGNKLNVVVKGEGFAGRAATGMENALTKAKSAGITGKINGMMDKAGGLAGKINEMRGGEGALGRLADKVPTGVTDALSRITTLPRIPQNTVGSMVVDGAVATGKAVHKEIERYSEPAPSAASTFQSRLAARSAA